MKKRTEVLCVFFDVGTWGWFDGCGLAKKGIFSAKVYYEKALARFCKTAIST
jgi:hypothetical protein